MMPKDLPPSYNDEINSWIHSIDFYLDELLTIQNRLGAVIARNTIVGIAAKTEVHQLIVGKIENKLSVMKKEMETMKKQYSKKKKPKNDDTLKGYEEKISSMREDIRKIEKEFAEVKFHCNDFIAEMMRKGDK